MKPCMPTLNPVDVINLGDSVTFEVGAPLAPVKFVAVGGWFQTLRDSVIVTPEGTAWAGLGQVLGIYDNWAPPPASMMVQGVAVHCNGTRWMAAGVVTEPTGPGTAQVYTSIDGRAWSKVTSPSMSLVTGIASNGSMWVISCDATAADGFGGTLCSACDALAYSLNNGSTWTSINVTGIFDGLNVDGLGKRCSDVLYNAHMDMWVASGTGGTGHALHEQVIKAYSSDGIHWTPVIDTNVTAMSGGKLACNGATWLHSFRIGNQPMLERSSDGIHWTTVVDSSVAAIFGSAGAINSLAWNGLRWLAVGNHNSGLGADSPIIAYSSDGVTWHNTSQTVFGNSGVGSIYDIISDGDVTVAVGDSNCLVQTGHSVDGITWVAGDYTGDAFVAVYCCGGDDIREPPVVDAGPDQMIFSNSTTMAGTASDDGRPGPLTVAWSQVSGSGSATFTDPTSLTTSVTLAGWGVHVLQLSVSDGQYTVVDTVSINWVPA